MEDLHFNGYRFSSNRFTRKLIEVDLNRCQMEGAILTGVVLYDSRMRSAKLNKCILDGADLRRVDLTGAFLQDISCQATRFSGANFRGVLFKNQDVANILAALYTERARYPDEFDEAWFKDALKILSSGTV